MNVVLTFPGQVEAACADEAATISLPLNSNNEFFEIKNLCKDLTATGTFTEEDEGAFVSVVDVTQEEDANDNVMTFTVSLSHVVDIEVGITATLNSTRTNDSDISPEALRCDPSGPTTPQDQLKDCDFTTEDSSAITIAKGSKNALHTVAIRSDNIQSTHSRKSTHVNRADPIWGPKHFSLDAALDPIFWAGNQGQSMWNVHMYQNNDENEAKEEDHIEFDGFIYDQEQGTVYIYETTQAWLNVDNQNSYPVTEDEAIDIKLSIRFSHQATARVPVNFEIFDTTNQGPNVPATYAKVCKDLDNQQPSETDEAYEIRKVLDLLTDGCDVVYNDRKVSGGSMVFNAAETGDWIAFRFVGLDDVIAEPKESFSMRISSVTTSMMGMRIRRLLKSDL